MTDSYTITWEEFLEHYLAVHPDALPRLSIASFITAALIAIPTVVFAVFLTHLAPPENKTKAAFIFMSLPLLPFAVAFMDRIQTLKKSKLAEQELRSVYQKEYAGVQSFIFDHEGWTLTTPGSKLKNLWAGLVMSSERQTTIALWTKDHLTLLPKRILSAERIAALRRLALTSGESVSLFHVGVKDYLLTEIPSFWRRNPTRPVFHLAAAAAVFVITRTFIEKGSGLIWAVVGAMLVGVANFILLPLYLLIKYVIDRKSKAVSWEGEFSERGARAKTSDSDIFLAWSCFNKFEETRRCFLLYTDAERYYILVKSYLAAEQQNALRLLFKAKLAGQ